MGIPATQRSARGPKARLTMVPTNSAQRIISHKPRREGSRGKRKAEVTTRSTAGGGAEAQVSASCVVGWAGSVASHYGRGGASARVPLSGEKFWRCRMGWSLAALE